MRLYVLLFLLYNEICWCLPPIIKIGGLFQSTEDVEKIAFEYAVKKVNEMRDVLPRSSLVAQTEIIHPHNSFQTSRKVCSLLQQGVAAIFGPDSPNTANHVQSICDAKEIPHIETRWDAEEKRRDYSINLYPDAESISKAQVDLVTALGWTKLSILYEDNDSLMSLHNLMERIGMNRDAQYQVKQLPDHDNYRPLLNYLKDKKETHIFISCHTDKIIPILTQAMQVSMLTGAHNYIFSSLDLHSLDLTSFTHSKTNITGMRMINPESSTVSKVIDEWLVGELRYSRQPDISAQTIQIKAALIYDAVRIFAKALHKLDSSKDNFRVRPISCNSEQTWSHGMSLINYMKMENLTERDGLTGRVEFDEAGKRSEVAMEIVSIKETGAVPVATWSTTNGIKFKEEEIIPLSNKTLVVTTALSDPYTMFKQSTTKLHGNDQFEGFAIDLIDKIAKHLNFNYTIKLVDDGKYGAIDAETGEWNGMIREVMDEKADLAIVDLTITADRESAVDFSMPFMNIGISILYQKPRKSSPNLFSFLSPLSEDVWLYMTGAYLGVSVLLFVLARITPYEWNSPHPCNDDPEELENELTLSNAFWHNWGSLMQQGSDIAPKAVSTRLVAGMWWFFTLIMISSYTANLAAFLTVENLEQQISSAEDLADQTKIRYGSLETGSTTSFFRKSKIETYAKMGRFMDANKEVYTKSNDEGRERVKDSNGEYAYLMESSSIEYTVERHCTLTQVGGLLDNKGYGIALKQKSHYVKDISNAILHLQEKNELYKLKTKWWKEKGGGGQCKSESSSSGGPKALPLANVGGVFVALIGGMGLACGAAAIEFFWTSWQNSREYDVGLLEEVSKELKFAVTCRGNTKPVRKKKKQDTETDGESETFIPPSTFTYSSFAPLQYDPYYGSKSDEAT